jgi:flagellar motor protein MotB
MTSEFVNLYSDKLFNRYNRADLPVSRGDQDGWPYLQTSSLLRIFPAAAEPHIKMTTPSASSSSSASVSARPESNSSWLQTFWPVCVGGLVVVGCVVALGWRGLRQAPATVAVQQPDTEAAKLWREAAQQLAQSHLAEARVLSSNRVALAASQAQIGDSLAKLCTLDSQLVATAATQASAIRSLAQETTNLVPTVRQTLKEGFAEAASQTRTDTVKLQTQVAEVAANQRALLDRFVGPTNMPNLVLAVPGVRTRACGNSILLTFDDGLFLHGTYFKRDAESRLREVAKALAQLSTPLRIEVIGCADDDRAFKSWTAQFEESLALSRAMVVVKYFIELGAIAPKRLAALSSDAANRPFPGDTPQNRAKNRTVMLRILTPEAPLGG